MYESGESLYIEFVYIEGIYRLKLCSIYGNRNKIFGLFVFLYKRLKFVDKATERHNSNLIILICKFKSLCVANIIDQIFAIIQKFIAFLKNRSSNYLSQLYFN